ncbi:MAG: glycosyltransferase [Thermoanaerobaculia bacterium]
MVVYGFLDLADGGAQRLTLATCRWLRPDRFRSRLLCVRGRGRLVEAARRQETPVDCLERMQRSWDSGAVGRIVRRLREIAPAILHVPLYSRASPYLRLAGRFAGVPLTVAHEWSRPEPVRFARRIADRVLRSGTRFVAASEAQRGELLASGVDPDRVEVVRAGVDCERFAAGNRESTRAALGLAESDVVALVPARLHRAKGHRDLLAAISAIRAAAPELRILLAGSGPAEAELRSDVESRGLQPVVRFLGQRDDVPDLLAAADLVVLPSHVEGLPSALLEAMAAARAVVATDVGGVGEALRDGEEGRLVPARDPQALALALTELVGRADRRREYGERGRLRAVSGFHVRRATRDLEAVYEHWLRSLSGRE